VVQSNSLIAITHQWIKESTEFKYDIRTAAFIHIEGVPMTLSKTTRDHKEIRRWAESRGAIPSEVASTHNKNEPGILRFHFPKAPGEKDNNLREISWDAFFEKFDDSNLELVYQEKTADGERSNFNKLVHPEESASSKKSSSAAKNKSGTKSSKNPGRSKSDSKGSKRDEEEE
jgi:hypothetical protein